MLSFCGLGLGCGLKRLVDDGVAGQLIHIAARYFVVAGAWARFGTRSPLACVGLPLPLPFVPGLPLLLSMSRLPALVACDVTISINNSILGSSNEVLEKR